VKSFSLIAEGCRCIDRAVVVFVSELGKEPGTAMSVVCLVKGCSVARSAEG
jgi:hypothetical protein